MLCSFAVNIPGEGDSNTGGNPDTDTDGKMGSVLLGAKYMMSRNAMINLTLILLI